VATTDLEGKLERRLVGDIEGKFFVPSYQRGYRWGPDEVLRLLDDIAGSGDADYYLQPVVVKAHGDEWELVDGQQRLTTLFLILQYLKNTGLKSTGADYTMRYATRQGSATYLLDPDEAAIKSNIDYFHIHQAYATIASWFDGHGSGGRKQYAADKFFTALFAPAYVVWFEAPAGVDATDLFTRLNIGRIPLTDSELVKALVLARVRASDGNEERAISIATEWDAIERGLRAPEVWAFVSARDENTATRIDLLLDAAADRILRAEGRPVPHRDNRPPFLTFETLRPKIVESPKSVWNEVADLYSIVQGWYDDRSLFHKVGFLTATGLEFVTVLDESAGRTKSDFDNHLTSLIRERLNLSSDRLAELSYESRPQAKRLSDVLLLLNVVTVSAMADSSERYSFSAHARGVWSLEHVNAQQTDRLNRESQWTAWLQVHRDALSGVPGLDPKDRVELEQAIDQGLADLTREKFLALEARIVPVFDADDDDKDEATHSIWNLALLSKDDNSALNKAVFEVKRRRIIQRDKEGSYIPVCTRNLFLKYYSHGDDIQLHFWSQQDRESYLAEIRKVLTDGNFLMEDAEPDAAELEEDVE
jgi:hypothetical protein